MSLSSPLFSQQSAQLRAVEPTAVDLTAVAAHLLNWWDTDHADLPWRQNSDPYAVWVSEIMLQQTQITAVIPYYSRWMAALPTVAALAAAPLDAVLKLWEGLGYYSRARNLHHAAQTVMEQHGGKLPQTAVCLQTLKGIGPYTAGAIASIAFAEPAPVVDGNVTRLFSRLLDLEGDVTTTAVKKRIWQLAETAVPAHRPGEYNQALMELGQTLCRPKIVLCGQCPIQSDCLAHKRGTQMERPVRPPRKKTPHYDVAAGIIWKNEEQGRDGLFLIAKRPLDGMLGGMWEFPGGKQEAGETLPQTLRREIQEELGMDIEVGESLIAIKHAFTHFRITLHAMHAVHRAGEPQHYEVADHAWVTLADLDQYPFAVTDQKIIAALRQSF